MPRGQHPNSRAALDAHRRSYPPAPVGNRRALRSGHAAEKALEPYAGLWERTFLDSLREESALLTDEEFLAYIAVGSRVFARLELVGNWLTPRLSDMNGKGVMQALEAETKLRREALEFLQSLRLGPLASEEQELLDTLQRIEAQIAERPAAVSTPIRLEYEPRVIEGEAEELTDGS